MDDKEQTTISKHTVNSEDDTFQALRRPTIYQMIQIIIDFHKANKANKPDYSLKQVIEDNHWEISEYIAEFEKHNKEIQQRHYK